MATQRQQVTRPSAAGEAADQELVQVLKSTIHAKVLANLDHIVDEAVNTAIVEAAKIPGEDPVAPEIKLTGHTTAINRPKSGGMCAAVWDELDKQRSASGAVPTLEQVRKLAKRKKWNANNARIEYYRWRAHNGITRRAASAQPADGQVKTATYTGPDRRAARQEARA